jgi:hypothetical protein
MLFPRGKGVSSVPIGVGAVTGDVESHVTTCG